MPRSSSSSRKLALNILGLLLLTLILMAIGGCSTKAIAIHECREIEDIRCEGSASCEVIGDSDVAECKRFYHDQCLHGIFGTEEPSTDEQNRCTTLLNSSVKIADSARGDQEQANEYEAACRIIATPWLTTDCRFLIAQNGAGGANSSETKTNQ